jgi:hypothetical protein
MCTGSSTKRKAKRPNNVWFPKTPANAPYLDWVAVRIVMGSLVHPRPGVSGPLREALGRDELPPLTLSFWRAPTSTATPPKELPERPGAGQCRNLYMKQAMKGPEKGSYRARGGPTGAPGALRRMKGNDPEIMTSNKGGPVREF